MRFVDSELCFAFLGSLVNDGECVPLAGFIIAKMEIGETAVYVDIMEAGRQRTTGTNTG